MSPSLLLNLYNMHPPALAQLPAGGIREMAERMGFEPTRHVSTPTPLAGERLQPLGHLSVALALGALLRGRKTKDCFLFASSPDAAKNGIHGGRTPFLAPRSGF